MKKQPYGLNCLMLTAAHRYCLGRSSYIVEEFVTWFMDHYDNFDINAVDMVLKETKEDLRLKQGNQHVHACDTTQWQYLIKFIEKNRCFNESEIIR